MVTSSGWRFGPRVGFIGVGEIARALVEGLSAGPDPAPPIALSPRGATVSAELAARFPNAHVCVSNQDVVDDADIVIVSVRPEHWEEALAGLRVTAEQVVISAMAGVSHDELGDLLGTSAPIIRAIPLPAVRHRTSVTVTYPSHPVSTALFDRLGGTLAIDDDQAFSALSTVTGTISSHLHYLATIATWAAEHRVPAGEAERYVRAVFANLAPALLDPERLLAQLTTDHETPGGINEQLRSTWLDDDNARALVSGLDALLDRLT
jgi:pyrroline-5-carboxylate reductase